MAASAQIRQELFEDLGLDLLTAAGRLLTLVQRPLRVLLSIASRPSPPNPNWCPARRH